MKKIKACLTIALLIFYFQTNLYAQNFVSSISKDIEIAVDIDIARKVAPGISVEFNRVLADLYFDRNAGTFAPFDFDFFIWVDSPLSDEFTVDINLSGLSMACTTRKETNFYSDIGNGSSSNFLSVDLIADGFVTPFTSAGSHINILGSMFRSVAWSREFSSEVPYMKGKIRIMPPLLDKEIDDGGATCSGNALIFFQSNRI